eukprot:7897219-Alexandrium_andersonii.AAC.1
MSASLVGSEMCIRDRGEGGHAPLGHGPRDRHAADGRQVVAERYGADVELCLLYTSDAADDM